MLADIALGFFMLTTIILIVTLGCMVAWLKKDFQNSTRINNTKTNWSRFDSGMAPVELTFEEIEHILNTSNGDADSDSKENAGNTSQEVQEFANLFKRRIQRR